MPRARVLGGCERDRSVISAALRANGARTVDHQRTRDAESPCPIGMRVLRAAAPSAIAWGIDRATVREPSRARMAMSVGLHHQPDMSVNAVQEPVGPMLGGIFVGRRARPWKGAVVVDDQNAARRQARVEMLQLVLCR